MAGRLLLAEAVHNCCGAQAFVAEAVPVAAMLGVAAAFLRCSRNARLSFVGFLSWHCSSKQEAAEDAAEVVEVSCSAGVSVAVLSASSAALVSCSASIRLRALSSDGRSQSAMGKLALSAMAFARAAA